MMIMNIKIQHKLIHKQTVLWSVKCDLQHLDSRM